MASKAVHYVKNIDYIRQSLQKSHNVFSTNGIKKTIVTDTEIFKDYTGFGSMDLAYECLYLWKQKGFSGSPTSPASFFREECTGKCNIKAGTNKVLEKHFHGGQISNLATGFHHGTAYLYDIISAYRWAGSLGLPTEVRYFSGHPVHPEFIALVRVKQRPDICPDFLKRKICVITNEDLERYKIKVEFIHGFYLYNFEYNPENDLEKLKYLPEKCFKLATQSYWGIWAMRSGIEVERLYDTGELKKWNLYNRNKNMIWSIIIVHRVIEKVFESVSNNCLNIYVDSILTKEKIKTGEKIGDWKLKNTFDCGVFIRNAGLWTSINNYIKNADSYNRWTKHSGYKG